MDQYPSNSKRPVNTSDEPKKIARVVEGEVVRRKTPISRRMSQNLIGGDAQSVWGYVFGEVLIPAARDMVADAVSGGVERMIFGEHSPGRSRGRSRGGSVGHVPYNRPSAITGRTIRNDEPRREISRRARSTHSFDEIILASRHEAEEVLDRLDDLCARYQNASVADFYELCGISGNYTDDKWGWTEMHGASVSRVRNGYLLNLPKPEQLG